MRIIAALVLAPVAIAIAYAGGVLWMLLVTLAAIGLYVEWLMVIGAGHTLRTTMAGALALAAAGLCLGAGRLDAALSVLAIGLIVVAVISSEQRRWTIAGFCYAAVAEVASVLLRQDPEEGFVALLFVLLVVWATDIGGYFAGRSIGGPKLWPRVSPKKTWAGAVGSFVGSLVVAAGFAVFGLGAVVPLLVLGAVLSVVSQFGDLFEVRGEAAVRREGFQPSHSRPWRADGPAGRLRRRGCRCRNFWLLAGRRGWRRPRSYGLVRK